MTLYYFIVCAKKCESFDIEHSTNFNFVDENRIIELVFQKQPPL